MKSISILGFTFIILIIIFSSSSFFSYLNHLSVHNIAYGSSSSPSSSLSGQNQQLIDKIAIKITEAKPSADYVSVKKVIERLALQKQNAGGGNVQESLTNILNQVSNPESQVVDNIANLALKENVFNTQQQPSSPSSLSGQTQQLIDKIAIKITEAKPSADYVSVKKVIEKMALQKENTGGGNVQESLTRILNQVSQNPESQVVDNIVKQAVKESASNIQQQHQPSNIQQQNQVTPQPTNDFSNRTDTMVSEKALEIDPTNIDALVKKGLTLYMLDKSDEAIQYFDKALQIDPNDADALFMKGDALWIIDKYDEAVEYYLKALEIDPDKYNEAIEYYDNVLERDSNNTNALFLKGVALDSLDRHEEGIQYFDKALQIDPNDADALFMKGLALSHLERYDEAKQTYDKLLNINSSDTDALYIKGLALNSLDRYDEAIQFFDKVLQIDPNDTEALYFKGDALRALDRNSEAIQNYDKVLQTEPNDTDVLNNKGDALKERGR